MLTSAKQSLAPKSLSVELAPRDQDPDANLWFIQIYIQNQLAFMVFGTVQSSTQI
jgi:hypothetical protein